MILSDPGIHGVQVSLSEKRLRDLTLADDNTNSIPTLNGKTELNTN